MENKKLTKKEVFSKMLEVSEIASNDLFVEFINHELELLDRKSSKSTQTKTQIENESIKNAIVESLERVAKAVTITELQELDSEMANYSNQKLSALLKQLVKENRVVKTVDKKKSYFFI
jgi:precorrin-3B methylase